MYANIKVIVKVRPRLGGKKEEVAWKVEDSEIVQTKQKQEGSQPLSGQRPLEGFAFEHICDDSVSNQDVYEKGCSDIIKSVMEGYNGTIFLYGQTKSGKTYTMLGQDDKPGILQFALKDLFAKRNEQKDNYKMKVYVSYLEIYNEVLIDLLNPKGDPAALKIKDDQKMGIIVKGLRQQKVKNVDEAMHLLRFGEEFRKYRVTDYNQHSSRSHTIYKVHVESYDCTGSTSKRYTFSCLNMVDLAGSERLSTNNESEETEKETKFINKSLFYLTKVIQLLSIGNQHIPFRDSKLTRVISDALGGNCLTVLIANVSPLIQDSVQTISTLKFAARAKTVQTQPKRVEITTEDNEEMIRMTAVIDTQNAQILERDQLILKLQEALTTLKPAFDVMKLDLQDSKEQLSKEKALKSATDRKSTSNEIQLLKEEVIRYKKKVDELQSELAECHEKLADAQKEIILSSRHHSKRDFGKLTSTKASQTAEEMIYIENLDAEKSLKTVKSKPPSYPWTGTLNPSNSSAGLHDSLCQPVTINSPRRARKVAISSTECQVVISTQDSLTLHPKTSKNSHGTQPPKLCEASNNQKSHSRERWLSGKAKTHRIPTLAVETVSHNIIATSNHSQSNSVNLAEAGSVSQYIYENRRRKRHESASRGASEISLISLSKLDKIGQDFVFTATPNMHDKPTTAALTDRVGKFVKGYAAKLKACAEEFLASPELFSTMAEYKRLEAVVGRERGKLLRRFELVSEYCSEECTKATQCTGMFGVSTDGKTMQPNDNKHYRVRMVKALNSMKECHLLLWGDTSQGKIGQSSKPMIPTPTFFPHGQFKSISLGESFSAAIDDKGRLCTWGQGDYLGAESADRAKPLLVKTLSSKLVAGVKCGRLHALCLTVDGVVFAWGNNKYGQLGQGKPKSFQVEPQPIAKLMGTFVTKLEAGPDSSAVITCNDELYTWGCNDSGQLFSASLAEVVYTPERVLDNKCIISLSLGESHSLCLDLSSVVYGSGKNDFNQLGPSEQLHPLKLDNKEACVYRLALGIKGRVTSFFAGPDYSLFLMNSGIVYSCGKNTKGCLGIDLNSLTVVRDFTQVQLPSSAIKLFASFNSVIVQLDTKEYYGWGDNSCFLVSEANSDPSEVGYSLVPKPVLRNFDQDVKVSAIALSSKHAAALYTVLDKEPLDKPQDVQ